MFAKKNEKINLFSLFVRIGSIYVSNKRVVDKFLIINLLCVFINITCPFLKHKSMLFF